MSEPTLRFIVFAGAFITLALLEIAAPRRRSAALSRLERWPGAAALFALGVLIGRLLAPAGLASVALWAQSHQFGLFNLLDVPLIAAALISLIALDFLVWVQHVLMHRFDWLWRFHRVHHADPHLDVTTALRFHPGEILLSLIWKVAAVLLLGAPAFAVIIFEMVLNASAQFNHANIALPSHVERLLRRIIVTPDMHRVHHSVEHDEANTNFGFCLSWWDRLFARYRAQPRAGHDDMMIGQHHWRAANEQSPLHLLRQPLARPIDIANS